MNSSKLTLKDLLKQRQNLANAEQAYKTHQQLSQKRELLEETIVKLQEEIEQDFYHFHAKRQEIEHFQTLTVEKRNRLQKLKQAQKELDDLLDQTEDLTIESLEEQRYQLLLAIWLLYPAQREAQEAKWAEWNFLHLLEAEIKAIEEFLFRLIKLLEITIQARQSIKGKGILNYIFGISPNMIIEQQLFQAQHFISKTLPLLQNLIQQSQQDSPLYALFKDIYTSLDSLRISCRSPWSFSHIDTVFSQAHEHLLKLTERLKREQENLIQRDYQLKEEVDEWIQCLEKQ